MPHIAKNAKGEKKEKSPEITRFFAISGLGGGRWIRTTEGIASRFTGGKKAAYSALLRVFDNFRDNERENFFTFLASCFFLRSV